VAGIIIVAKRWPAMVIDDWYLLLLILRIAKSDPGIELTILIEMGAADSRKGNNASKCTSNVLSGV
jgi:hypothetical protein